MAARTEFEKALAIVEKFDGRLASGKIKEKIVSQCNLTKGSASTYFYICRDEIKKRATKKATKSNARTAVGKKAARK